MTTERPAENAAPRRGGIPRGIATDGPALLSYGFRPFFLAAGLFGMLSMILWLGALVAGWPVGGLYLGIRNWHAHEMLFGYTAAVLAGFMLTAIPNWTGRLPVSGPRLALLVGLWLAGRLGMLLPDALGPLPAIAVDAAFLPALAAIAAREILAGRNWKNLKILAALCALAAANIAIHAALLLDADPAPLFRLTTAIYLLLIGLVGGRIVPSFTRNWLARQGASHLPRPFGRRDIAALLASLAAFACWVVLPESPVTAGAAALAALLQLLRLAGWRGHRTLAEPLVAILHAAYCFLPAGLAAIALAALGWLGQVAVLHVLTVGGIGTMTLAVMTRATLGHTGRPLAATGLTVPIYLAILAAALLRPLADMMPDLLMEVLALSGACWILAFGLFTAGFGPMLVSPRLAAGKPQSP